MIDIHINEFADVPIWIQIRNRIIYLMRAGQLHEGDRLPSVRELAVKLGINFNTVSKTYTDLEKDGFIVTKRGRGTFVCTLPKQEESNEDSPVDILIEELIKAALSNGVEKDELLHRINEHLARR